MIGAKNAGTASQLAASWMDWVLPILFFAVVCCATTWPRALPVFFSLLALGTVGLVWQARSGPWPSSHGSRSGPIPLRDGWRSFRVRQLPAASIGFLALAAYCALTGVWAPSTSDAVLKASWLLLLVLTVTLVVLILPALSEEWIDRILRCVVVASLLGGLYVVHEVLRHQALARFVYNTIPFLNPGPSKHVVIEGNRIVAIGDYVMNRNVGALNLVLWPAALCLAALGQRWAAATRGRVVGVFAALLAITLFATLPSQHESSQIAIVVSGAVLLLAWWHLPAARLLVLAGWLAASLTMLPVVTLAYKAGLQTFKPIPETGRARIVLWNFTAQKFLERPFLGVGVHATHAIDDELKPTAKKQPDLPYAERTGQHGHNVFVQAWFELGLVGALMLSGSGCLLWQAINRLPIRAQPLALASATAAMCIGAFTWGLWQEWYLSLFALGVLLIAVGGHALDRIPGGRAAVPGENQSS